MDKDKQKILINTIILTMIFVAIPSFTFANGIESSTIFTGLKKVNRRPRKSTYCNSNTSRYSNYSILLY